MANIVRLYDADALTTAAYVGRWSCHIDSFSGSYTEIDVPVAIPGDPTHVLVFYVGGDPADVAGGFDFDSTSPPAWAYGGTYIDASASWPSTLDAFGANPGWDDLGFAASIDPASDPDWYLPPVAPTIAGFTPTSVRAGDIVTAAGTSLMSVTAVDVGGVPPASFRVINGTTLTFVAGMSGGTVTVTNPAGSDTSTATLTVDPWVQLLASLDDVTESYDIAYFTSNTSEGVRFAGCALTDDVALIAYCDVAGANPGRVRAVTVGMASLAVGTPATFDGGVDFAQQCELTSLDTTHALVSWQSRTGTWAAVVASTGGAPTVSAPFSLPVSACRPMVGLSSTLALVTPQALVHVASGVITAVDDLSSDIPPQLGVVELDMVRLNDTRFLLIRDDFEPISLAPRATFIVVDVASGVALSPATTDLPAASSSRDPGAHGWLRADGTVVQQWNTDFDLYVVEPNAMSGPIVLAEPSALGFAVGWDQGNEFSIAPTSNDDTLIIQALGDGPSGQTGGAALGVLSGTALGEKGPPLDLPGVLVRDLAAGNASVAVMIAFVGRTLLLADDATTRFGLLCLLAPDLPARIAFADVSGVRLWKDRG